MNTQITSDDNRTFDYNDAFAELAYMAPVVRLAQARKRLAESRDRIMRAGGNWPEWCTKELMAFCNDRSSP